ncbi:MAG: PEP-CTERM/exosortase system-associated acyltransferase [Rhodocyclaceae bacterium]|nr:PEP-CTERM/exosortase system-associated acyltransferase [Rhodocyclaceae bacterium]
MDMLHSEPRRDLLTPYFGFTHLMREKIESALFRDIRRLRYEVYCLECRYLDAQDYGDGLESDAYDERSFHVAAHSLDGLLVGTVRLVLAGEGERFPFEEHCAVFADFVFPPRVECAEVSRLVVRRSFRRRPGDSREGISKEFQEKGSVDAIAPEHRDAGGKHRRSNSPQIMLGMYREMYRHSRRTGIRYWFAAMESGLARSLDRMGFRFVPAGPETDYYGPVTTYIVDLRELGADLRKANEFLARWFNDEPISLWLMLVTFVKFKLGRFGKL